jgi:phosphoribosyl-ATP pyrophosphohydrolase/phosphoribosyl-AMP cyclohydrolase
MRTSLSGLFVFARHAKLEKKMKTELQAIEIDFKKMDGLVPAIVQDSDTGEILMLGFINPESLDITMKTGFVTFYSRTRQKLWMKGETSGNRLEVISASTDCDVDTLLFRVRVQGDGLVCHEGTRSCFTKDIPFEPKKNQEVSK